MADLDLEDVDKPSRAPARPRRFAPKGSKLKPKDEPKAEPIVSAVSSAEVEVDASRLDDVAPMDVDAKTEAVTKDESMEAIPNDESMEAIPNDESMECKEEEEEEDTVVREIDVYFTPPSDANSKLYVLQYPLRPAWRPYEMDYRCKEVRVKPHSTEMEVDLAVDVDSKSYDKDADPALKMNKQTLKSSWMLPKSTAYAVGVLVGNKLHLNPIHAIVQLRPSTKHLDHDKQKSVINGSLEDSVKLEESTDKKSAESLKKQGPSKSATPLNEQNKDIAETWLPLKYHGVQSDISARCLHCMVRQDESPLQFSMSRSDYVKSFSPIASTGDTGPKDLWEWLSHRKEEPWQENLKAWLVEGPSIHRFAALLHIAPNVSAEEFLVELQKNAKLVQGLWVPKSPLVYKQDVGENIFARDYILSLFSENRVIKTSTLPSNARLLSVIKGVLNTLATERTLMGDWKFKVDEDRSFIKEYPGVFEEERAAWKLFKEKQAKMFENRSMIKNRSNLGAATASNSPLNTSSKQTVKNSSSGVDAAAVRMPMPDETREALTHALQKLFHTQKVCSANQIRQRLRDMALSESIKPKGSKEVLIAALGVDNSSKELQAVIGEVCVNIHGVCVPKSSPDNPEFDEFRKVVIDLFLADGPNAKIKKAAIKEAAKMKLKREIKDNEFQKVVHELCVSQGGAWVLKSGDGNSR